MATRRWITIFLLMTISILSCSLLTSPAPQAPAIQEPPINVETAVARTRAFDFAVQTAAAGQGGDSGQVVQPTIQQIAPTVEPTAGPPTVSVSMDTNCRKGPSTIYEDISYLLVGKTSEVVNKYQNGAWWVIKDPNNPNQRCWLWGYYATVSGNWQQLPEATQPPTPTVGLVITINGSATPGNYTGVCPVNVHITFEVTTTLPVTIAYSISSNRIPFSALLSEALPVGTKTYSYNAPISADGNYWEKFVITNPVNISRQVDYTVNCTP